ncbi:hypothetical protein SEVIR_5G153850v4 [Setaria viridis]|uniref:Uncharacterized protein n=1 Tax=Setaria viridis TaxID=4556 RepID=A0A4U6UHQ2_SETVI|nr:hypothetical protein SEVIR_5G153850v2 [Setaria viridis]TKW14224.1 hypothetical protein SEVIR_5G153850v2 [Setaria viridis]
MAMPSLPVGSPSPDGPRHPCPPSRCRLSGTACSPPAMCHSCRLPLKSKSNEWIRAPESKVVVRRASCSSDSVLVREEEQDERDGPSRCRRRRGSGCWLGGARESERGGKRREETNMWVHL